MIEADELARVIADHVAAAIAPLQARLAALEARSKKIAYAGVWNEGAQYAAGEFCTFKGGLWACLKSTSAKPGESQDWQLAVKSHDQRRARCNP